METEFETKRVIEALLFASNTPLTPRRLKNLLEPLQVYSSKEVEAFVLELKEEYQAEKRAFQIDHIGEGFLLRSSENYRTFIDAMNGEKRGERLSPAALEVLAIIAHKQPITKPQIEAIRGVDSASIVQTLQEKGLVETSGKLEVPGRPSLFSVTKAFLQHFGLKEAEEIRTV